MDLITIIWYFSTFLLLILFFVVMVCSDNVCNRRRSKPEDIPVIAPPTPAPSYREFAPPGYDTVMKKYKNRIYIVPLEDSNEPGIFQPAMVAPVTSSFSSPAVTPVTSRTSVQMHRVSNDEELQVVQELQRNQSLSNNDENNSISAVQSEESGECVEEGPIKDVQVTIVEGSSKPANEEDLRSFFV